MERTRRFNTTLSKTQKTKRKRRKFPNVFFKKEINRILDDTLGITKCIKCKTKIMRTECTSVEQKQRGWCTRCWQRQYGRLHKPGKRPRQFVEY